MKRMRGGARRGARLEQRLVLARAAQRSGGISVGERAELRLVGGVGAHDIAEEEDAAGAQASGHGGEQLRLVAGVAEHLAGPDVVEGAIPFGREGVVEVAWGRRGSEISVRILAKVRMR